MLWQWFRGLVDLGAAVEDDSDDRLRKATLTLAAALMATLAIAWVATYWRFGLWRSGAIPLGYQIATVVGLIAFARTKRLALFCKSQLVLMLALPFLLQVSLGGFRQSSVVALWAVTAPLGALFFEGVRRSTWWFAAFAAGLVALGLLEPRLKGEGPVPNSVVVTFFVLNVLGVAITVFLLLRYFISERTRIYEELRVEQGRSESLLLNVLPISVAQRLKETPGVIADSFADVTVLFADIVGFTEYAKVRSAQEVVVMLNVLFSAFDELSEQHGLEKIKTIGDAYMVVAGLPVPRGDHQLAMAAMALDMCDAVERFRGDTGSALAIRVGVSSGPVVAGVIGHKKFSYDVWGDTVNMASRMEAHGVTGRVQVTHDVYEGLRDDYEFEPRGSIDVKGKGLVTTYLLGPALRAGG